MSRINSFTRPDLAVLDRDTLIAISVLATLIWLIHRSTRPRLAPAAGLVTIPGVAIFGNLLQLGWSNCQVRELAGLAKRYGPIFQMRLGNRVSVSEENCREGEHC